MNPQQLLITTVVSFAVFLGKAHADSEIKLQGRSTISSLWFEIDDDNGSDDDDSPRGGNGTTFGNVKLGESKTRDFRIQNTGNETLNITSAVANSSQFDFIGLNLPIAILANKDHEFKIRYTPGAFGTRTLRIGISNDEGPNNSSERNYTFRVDGTGKGPSLTIFGGTNQDDAISDNAGIPAANNSEGRHFGTVQAGDIGIETRSFTLSNSGNDGLNLSNPRITGPDAAAFSYNGVNAGVNLGDGNARTFTILFNPPVTGTYDATFSVDTNDERSGRGTYSFAIRAEAIGEPLLRLEGKSGGFGSSFTRIFAGDQTPRGTDGTDWGNRRPGAITPLQDHEFRITNYGGDDLTITNITTSNEIVFPINDISLPLTLERGEEQSFYVRFTPRISRDYSGTISISSDNAIASLFEFAVAGSGSGNFVGFGSLIGVRGFAGNQPTQVAISDGQIDTGEIDGTRISPTIVGQTRTANFRIYSAGDSPLYVTASRSGSSNPEFVVVGLDNNFSLSSGTFHDFQVQWTPSEVGYRSTRIEIYSDDHEVGGIFNFNVGGFGTEEPNTQGPAALILGGENFEEKVISGSEEPNDDNGTVIGYNGTHQSQFSLFNDGDEDLKVTGFQFEGGEGLFQISGLDGDTVVPPGGIHEFTIDFTGPNGEEVEARVILETNDPKGEQYNFVIVSAEIDDPAPADPPRITAIETDVFDILLNVEAPATRTFQIFVSLDLESWIPLIGFGSQSAGIKRIPNQIIGPPTGQRRFYKVEED